MTDQRNAFTKQPRVRGNDWHKLMPAVLGAWHPTQTVSVVIPAYQAHLTLPSSLAKAAISASTTSSARIATAVSHLLSSRPVTRQGLSHGARR